MYSNSRGDKFSSGSKNVHRDDDKYKVKSYSSRAVFHRFVLICPILFLIWCFIPLNPFARSLEDVELEVERLIKGNGQSSQTAMNLDQDDDAVVDFVRKNYVFKRGTNPGNSEKGGTSSQSHNGLVEYLTTKNLIDAKSPGYFVEIGAHNGTGFTSTLTLDRDFGWSGLVVEPMAVPFKKMLETRERNRNKNGETEIITSRATISVKPYLNMGKFHYNPSVDLWGGLNYRFYKGTTSSSMVLCIPLYSLLLAAGVPKQVQLLIMDIEGSELEVLKTLPFEELEISIIVVETYNGKDGPTDVQDYLNGKGYKLVEKLKIPLEKELIDKISQIIVREDVHSEYTIFKLNE